MKRTKEDARLTREHLLDSALELMIKRGYSNVTLNDLAEFAGLTRGAFYWHFKSKEDILHAIINKEAEFLHDLMAELILNKELPSDKHLIFVIQGIIGNYFDNTRFRRFVELTWFRMESANFSNVINPKTIANEFFIEEIKKIIQKGMKDGSFHKEISPLEWSLQIVCVINGIYRLYFVTPDYMTRGMALRIVNNIIKPLLNSPDNV